MKARSEGSQRSKKSARDPAEGEAVFDTFTESRSKALVIPERGLQAMSLATILAVRLVAAMGEADDNSATPTVIRYKLQLGRRYKIGRSKSNDICLAGDVSVSRKHCYIDIDHRGCCVIQDLGATAGTFLNGSRIHRACLLIDDVILCGKALQVH